MFTFCLFMGLIFKAYSLPAFLILVVLHWCLNNDCDGTTCKGGS